MAYLTDEVSDDREGQGRAPYENGCVARSCAHRCFAHAWTAIFTLYAPADERFKLFFQLVKVCAQDLRSRHLALAQSEIAAWHQNGQVVVLVAHDHIAWCEKHADEIRQGIEAGLQPNEMIRTTYSPLVTQVKFLGSDEAWRAATRLAQHALWWSWDNMPTDY